MIESFGISIKEILNMEVLKDAKVLGGEKGLDKKVTKVNVMEVPDILDWVAPGEFLLTTAYSIKDDLSRLNSLIQELNSKGLAGIGIKTKRYIREIPVEVIETANNLNFPIIEIPFNVAYSDIITPVLAEIINKQTNTLKKIDSFHTRLMNVMLRGGSLKEIAEGIHESINNTIAIYDDVFQNYVLITKDDNKECFEAIIEGERGKNLVALKNCSKSYLKDIDNINGLDITRITIPIYTEDRRYGYLYIWEDKKKITPVELTVIESSTSLIALDLVKRISIYEIENKHRIEFFDDLLSNSHVRQKKALERSTFFDFDKKLNYSVIVITFRDIDKLVKLTPNNTNYLHHLNSKLLNIVERLARTTKGKILYGNKSDRIIVLFGTEDYGEVTKKRVVDFCKQVFEGALREHINENISIGIGRAYGELEALWKSYREATRAAENLKGNNNGQPIHYDDLGIYRILSYEELKPELYQFYREILEDLVNYDKEKDSELVKTLQMYFACGGNLKKISEEMFTHYNTIIYRMQRIRDITGINLENPNEKLNIQIALKIYEIYRNDI